MRALQRPLRAPFVEVLMDGFTHIWPEKASRLGIRYREFIESSIDRALSFGIVTESRIARFVNLDFVWGAEFEQKTEHGWALRILRDPAMNEKAKIEELVTVTRLKLMALQSARGSVA